MIYDFSQQILYVFIETFISRGNCMSLSQVRDNYRPTPCLFVLQSSRKNTRLVYDSSYHTRSMYGRAAHRNTADEHRDSVCALKQ